MRNRSLTACVLGPCLLGACLLGAAGCVSTRAPEQTELMRSLDVDVTARRLRVGAHNFARSFMADVELTADSIAGLTNDPRVRYNALVWKASAIPAIQVALYHPDPLVSFIDGWTLLVQMRDYLSTGGGRDLFGDQQDIAVRKLEEGVERIRVSAVRLQPAGGEDRFERFVYDWAEQHPLTNDRYLRASPVEAVADILGTERGGGFSSLGSMTEMAQDAQQMALVLASYAPKQVAWQSELLAVELTDSSHVTSLLRAIDDMEVVSATTEFMQVTPGLIAAERAAVFREVAKERLAILENIERQRTETLARLADILATERTEAIREISAERAAIFQEMQGLTSQAFAQTQSLIDRLMLRTGLALVGLAVLVVMGVALLRRRPLEGASTRVS